jgi:hypothetical protein
MASDEGCPAGRVYWPLYFAPNEIKRYSLGTRNQDLKFNEDGSLTIYVQSSPLVRAAAP